VLRKVGEKADISSIHSTEKAANTQVYASRYKVILNLYSLEEMKLFLCCLFNGSGTNAFRMASSNTSLTAKSCACAYIEFLAGIFSWYAESTFT
jgi:hypothetical protein